MRDHTNHESAEQSVLGFGFGDVNCMLQCTRCCAMVRVARKKFETETEARASERARVVVSSWSRGRGRGRASMMVDASCLRACEPVGTDMDCGLGWVSVNRPSVFD